MWRRVVEQRFPDVSKYHSALHVTDQSENFVFNFFFCASIFFSVQVLGNWDTDLSWSLAVWADYFFHIPDLIKFS